MIGDEHLLPVQRRSQKDGSDNDNGSDSDSYSENSS
jgi:hypothetical protein